MSTESSKPLVLVYGATGNSGTTLVDGLLRSGAFRLAVTTRTDDKPEVAKFKSLGIDIRVIDVPKATAAELKALLVGVDYVVSVISAWALESQRALFQAAKEAGVKRVVPSDFSTISPPGTMILRDKKVALHDYIKQIGVGYTFIDIGWWAHAFLPLPASKPHPYPPLDRYLGAGNRKVVSTNLDHIGDWVARILQDERTLNQAVLVWEYEITFQEAWDTAIRVSPEGEAIFKNKAIATDNDLQAERDAAVRKVGSDWSSPDIVQRLVSDYLFSVFVRGDNTVEAAKSMGILDARVLYPDVEVEPLDEFAKKYYKSLA